MLGKSEVAPKPQSSGSFIRSLVPSDAPVAPLVMYLAPQSCSYDFFLGNCIVPSHESLFLPAQQELDAPVEPWFVVGEATNPPWWEQHSLHKT